MLWVRCGGLLYFCDRRLGEPKVVHEGVEVGRDGQFVGCGVESAQVVLSKRRQLLRHARTHLVHGRERRRQRTVPHTRVQALDARRRHVTPTHTKPSHIPSSCTLRTCIAHTCIACMLLCVPFVGIIWVSTQYSLHGRGWRRTHLYEQI